MKKLVFLVAALMLSGCASYVIRDGSGKIVSKGNTHGFLWTITVVEKYDKAGRCTERRISSDSHTKDILLGLDSLIDTTVDTAAKLKP